MTEPDLEFSGVINKQTPDGRNTYETATYSLTPGKTFDGEDRGLYELLKEYLYNG